MPVERAVAEEPVPLYSLPESCNLLPELRLSRIGEVVAASQQALHQEGGLDKVGPVVVRAERDGGAAAAVKPVGERSMETLGLFRQEGGDLE